MCWPEISSPETTEKAWKDSLVISKNEPERKAKEEPVTPRNGLGSEDHSISSASRLAGRPEKEGANRSRAG